MLKSEDMATHDKDCAERPYASRASDDRRLTDIQESVHEIRSDVRGLERRFERGEERITDVERKVIENTSAQRALEQVMSSETLRLTDKIDTVNGSVNAVAVRLQAHSDQQSRDFKGAMRILVTILLSIFGTAGMVVIQHIMDKAPK
jgi:chromosome segregation ATPase